MKWTLLSDWIFNSNQKNFSTYYTFNKICIVVRSCETFENTWNRIYSRTVRVTSTNFFVHSTTLKFCIDRSNSDIFGHPVCTHVSRRIVGHLTRNIYHMRAPRNVIYTYCYLRYLVNKALVPIYINDSSASTGLPCPYSPFAAFPPVVYVACISERKSKCDGEGYDAGK